MVIECEKIYFVKKVHKKKVNKKGEKKFQKMYTKFVKNFKKYRFWQYVKKYDFEKFKENIFELLESKNMTYTKGKNLLNISVKFFTAYLNTIIRNTMIKNNDIEDNIDNIEYNIEDNIENPFIGILNNEFIRIESHIAEKANDIIIDFYIKIFDNIYKQFNKINEEYIVNILLLSINKNKFFDYIIKMNIKINNKKYLDRLKNLDYDYFDIIENITYDNIVESCYIHKNINLIKNILDRIFEKPDYDLFMSKFIDYKLELMLKDFGAIYCVEYFDSLNKYIIGNYKLNSEYKIKLILMNFIHYINLKYDILFVNVDDYNQIEMLKQFTDHNIHFDEIKNLVDEFIKNKEITLDMLYKADLNLMSFFYNCQHLESKNKIPPSTLYYETNHKIYLWYQKYDIKIYIEKCMNVFRNQFIKLFINKIKPEKNIENIINNKLFDFRDTFLTLEQKVELFKKSYSGKVKSYELDKFIISSNELSSFLIKNVPIQEKYIKYTIFTGNHKLLEIIADMKFHFKMEHLKYIISKNNLIDMIKIINKYKPFDFCENIEWYKYIEHLLIDIDITNILYNDDNEDLQIKLKKKIENYNNSKINISLLNNMEFNNLCKYIIENNIKLEMNDILKINDDNKRLFLFRNLSN